MCSFISNLIENPQPAWSMPMSKDSNLCQIMEYQNYFQNTVIRQVILSLRKAMAGNSQSIT